MRVWLIDDKPAESSSALEESLRRVQEQPETGLVLAGWSPFQPDVAAVLSKMAPGLVDVLVLNEAACPDGPGLQDVLSLPVGVLVVTSVERLGRFRAAADQHAVSFVPPDVSTETLRLVLVSLEAAHKRETSWKTQVAHLEQRIVDRITIERAKGILVRRLQIPEDEAYQRLRVLSRRQRRPIRDIAQSLLDSESLFSPETNGALPQAEKHKNLPGGQEK
jgi:AmiR/NasT family two-component response regulator